MALGVFGCQLCPPDILLYNDSGMDQFLNVEIREYINNEIRHLEEKYAIINEKNDAALKKSERTMNRRLRGMNEFREQIEKQARTFMTKEEYEINERLVNQKMDTLTKIVYIGVGAVILSLGQFALMACTGVARIIEAKGHVQALQRREETHKMAVMREKPLPPVHYHIYRRRID